MTTAAALSALHRPRGNAVATVTTLRLAHYRGLLVTVKQLYAVGQLQQLSNDDKLEIVAVRSQCFVSS
jgi:hypothetical protein